MRRHVRPVWHDAYDAQMELWRWYRTREGMRWMVDSYERNAQGIIDSYDETLDPKAVAIRRKLALEYGVTQAVAETGARPSVELLSDMYAAEAGRLIDCDPIYVSADMCDVVEAAMESFKPEPLMESDVMTPRGFMFYARPFVVPDRFDTPVGIQAVSWSRIWMTDSPAAKQAMLAALASTDSVAEADRMIELVNDDHDGINVGGLALTIYATRPDTATNPPTGPGSPRLLPMHLTPWYVGMTFDGNEVDMAGEKTGAEWWWRLVQVTWRLMQQKLAHRSFGRPDRPVRREAARLGFPPETEVVIVRLRHEQGDRQEPSGESANYSHRFIVGGHWRNQWYPSDGVHRQLYISPYVKGPEDKPLIVRPRRVFQWTR